ncbi:DUF2384 domain-containing protein [Maribrevibacterium harenarium]|uniref:DUF2384 domain-containing protein n=1 Tax=Maribrevibacterium harenarium TaxID=2589817 RepID=A0A501W4R6_9GAMM|nr:MbcA/ParS/Xre antitoxin family protein [Maribrevibacterium harenarium]TPE44579.1 DUF2384 domain-containing protein [Maribrevibacterium harenarium]
MNNTTCNDTNTQPANNSGVDMSDVVYTPFEESSSLSENDLLEVAYHVFANKQKAEAWLTRPALALGGATPMEFAKTPEGKTDVIDLMWKVHHGIFA